MSQSNASRKRDSERRTRVHLSLFDRAKFLLLFTLTYAILVWALLSENPLYSFNDAAIEVSKKHIWLFWLAAIEVLRQIHFLISEFISPYHRLWQWYFKSVDRVVHIFSDWTRYRISRVVKWLIWIAIVAVILGAIYKLPPAQALFMAPQALWSALPMLAQLAFAIVFILIQFVAMFWFLSRGGIDTYFPDDINTRFSDVWGQDHVVERIRENLLFLESPEEIEKHGGYVPGGILLWGPPGTGKTLLARVLGMKCVEQDYPCVIINTPWSGDNFNRFIQTIDQPCMILFDEFEKIYSREQQELLLTRSPAEASSLVFE